MTACPKSPPIRDPAWLKAQRNMASAVSGLYATEHESVVACHVRGNLGGGMGLKPGDDRTVPLLASEHGEQHRIGEEAFWRKYLPRDILLDAVVRWAEKRYADWKTEREAA